MTADVSSASGRTFYPVRRRDWAALALILLVAAVMRLSDLGGITVYLYDQGELSIAALDMLAGQGIPTTGIQSSAGVPNSPVTVYTLALPFALTSNVQAVTAMIALLNVLGVGLLWGITHRYIDPKAAAIAGLAYALHPYAITYSRSIWAQDYQTPFILFALLLGLAGFVEGKGWAQFACLPVFVWGLQIHYAAWTLLPVCLWLVWTGRRRLHPWAVAGGVALGALLLVPFALGASGSSGSFAGRTGTMRGIIQDDLRLRSDALARAADVATGRNMEYLDDPALAGQALPSPEWVWNALGALMAGGLAAAWAFRRWRRAAPLLTLWIVPPVAFFIPNWTGTGVYTHYFIYLIPALCVLLALSVAAILDRLRRHRAVQGAVIAAFGIGVLSWGWWYTGALHAADVTYTPDGFPTPLRHLMDIRADLLPYDDVLIVGGESNSSGYEVWRGLLHDADRCVREVVTTGGEVAIFPQGPFAVISPPSAPASALDALYNLDRAQEIPLRPGEGSYRVQTFDSGLAWNGAPFVDIPPARFANGVQLTGYQIDGDTLRLRWQLPKADPDLGYQRFFVHLLDANGERLDQRDVDFWPGRYWCAGDTVVTGIDLPLPDSVAMLRAGLYRLDEATGAITAIDVVDERGQPVAPWVDIGVGG